ncbi:hypothetical protein AOLI_G00319060 [Acnodon oligacanthus]
METPYQDLFTESPSLSQSLVQLKISDSPAPSCDSMRSDVSVDQPPPFKDGDPSSGHSSGQVKRSASPISSCVSMRSDVSINHPVTVKDGEPSPEYSLQQVNRSDSPEPSGLSMRNVSINHSVTFKDEDPSSRHSSLQVNISDPPELSFVSMRRAASMYHPETMKDRDVSSGLRHGHASMHVQESFKLNLKEKFQCMNEVITNQGNPALLKSRTANLLRCRLTKKSCAGLASLLSSESSHLRKLYLSQNKLRDSGVKLLCAGLNNPLCKLESLRLRGCKVTVKGCAALASALKSNPSQLKELHLSKNKVGDSGVKLICAVLENPLCKLEALWLWDCKVTDEGCAVLALALKSNPSHLRELNLRENPEIKSGREQLLALKHDEHYRLDELIM